MKRTLAILVLLVLLLVGCDKNKPSSPNPDVGSASDSYSDNWAYVCLTADQQRNYAAVYNAVQAGFATDSVVTVGEAEGSRNGISIALPVPLEEEEQVCELYNAFIQDNPQFFHLGSVYGYDGRQHGEKRRFTALKLTYTMPAAERQVARDTLETAANTLLGTLSDTMSAFEKEVALHDGLITRCTYHHTAAEADEPLTQYPTAFTAYGALVEGKAVCEGYARAFQYLLNAAGIPATAVAGRDEEDQPHLWNAVRLDNAVYYVDPTWDDTDDMVSYTYFNLTRTEWEKTYTFDDQTLGLTPTKDTAANYYRMTGAYLTTMRLEDIAEHVAERLSQGESAVHLRFSDSAFHNALFFVWNTAWFTDTVNACLPAEATPLGEYDLRYNRTYGTIAIYKKSA